VQFTQEQTDDENQKQAKAKRAESAEAGRQAG